MEDLVAVGVADAGDERLVLEQVLELARWRRIRSRQASRVSAGSSASGPELGRRRPGTAGRPPPAAGRPCPSGWDRGSGSRRARRRPAARPRRASMRPRRRGRRPRARSRGRRRSSSAASAGAASWKRPVSIGLTTISSRSSSRMRNLPRRRIRSRRWPTSPPARPACRGRRGAGASADAKRPASAAWNASATTVRSGSSGTARDCSQKRVLDSPGPGRTAEEHARPFDARRSGPRSRSPRTT